jgi:hypothetical protein
MCGMIFFFLTSQPRNASHGLCRGGRLGLRSKHALLLDQINDIPGEAEQDPDRNWHRNFLVKERVALLECSATAVMVPNARNRSRECHSVECVFHNLDPSGNRRSGTNG